MSFLTDEHEAVRQTVRKFTEEKVMPIADEYYRGAQEIPMDLIKQMANLGFFGMSFPEEWGGAGMDAVSMTLVTEELSRGWLGVGSVLTRNLITGTLILAHGTQEQKEKYLPGIVSGDILTAAAFTEPNAGSDTAGMQLRAVRDGDEYVFNGAKTWCTFANRAHILTVLARTHPDASLRHKGLSIILVEKEPGDHFHPPQLSGEYIPTVGYYGMRSFSLGFEDFRVPVANLIGGVENKGFYQLMATYEWARIQTAARAVGVAQAAFDAALKYSQERQQFGQAISEFQIIRHKLAHMRTQIEAGRQLTYYAARMKDMGQRCDLEAGMAKLFCAEMVEHVTSDAMQIFGGYGYSLEYPAHRFWRDGRVFKIFEGTSEIQAEVIAKRLLS
ncbi:acyl-CoA dehydrogenase family protein [Candidatus Amarolinea aalborgensis]|jgi:(2S)-methylsuccinyl-CoA dehydrogenase|uniref:acyl-CoA dehydrogenase family protein n=1 Tax=Candidatus Amarolinea aalborgensis TaxID=2249329 RepID=UPI003BF95FDC